MHVQCGQLIRPTSHNKHEAKEKKIQAKQKRSAKET